MTTPLHTLIVVALCFMLAECHAQVHIDDPRLFPKPTAELHELKVFEASQLARDFAPYKVHIILLLQDIIDVPPLLSACASAKVEFLTIHAPSNKVKTFTANDLQHLLTEGPSPIRFLSITGLSGWDGWETLPAAQFPHLQHVEIEGGNLTRESGLWFASLPSLHFLVLRPETISDGTIAALSGANLAAIEVGSNDLSCAAFGTWKNNFSLKYLSAASLNETSPNDGHYFSGLKGVECLAIIGEHSKSLPGILQSMPQIRTLSIAASNSETIKAISRMQHLNQLILATSDDAPLETETIGSLHELESLSLSGDGVTDSTIKSVSRLERLKRLSMKNNLITDNAMDSIGELEQLEELDISYCPIGTIGLNRLRRLQHLNYLNLEFTRVGPNAIPAIASLSSLRLVVVPTPEWTDFDRERLRSLRPDLLVDPK